MNKTVAGLIAIVLVLGSLSGFLFMQKSSLEQQVSTLTSEKENLTATLSKLNQEKESLETTVELQRKNITSLNEKISYLNRQISTLTSEKENLAAQITSLTHEKENLTATVAKLNQEKTKLEGIVESQRKNITSLNEQIDSLNQRISTLNQQVSDLTSQVQTLSNEKTKLQNTVSALNAEVLQLQDEKSSLSTQLEQTTSRLNESLNRLSNASDNYDGWAEFLLSYSTSNSYLNYTAKRVFNDEELQNLRDPLMNEVLTTPKYVWDSYQDIYNWITSNIKYVEDEPFPLPPNFNDFISGNVKDEVVYDTMMAPSQTISLKQGDCDDQAALAYAMIKSYEKYILGKEYTGWLMYVDFEEAGHVAVALPAIGSNNQTLLVIIDPAGHYLTKNAYGKIIANDPFVELNNYKNYWAEDGEMIQKITLYDIKDGVAYIAVSGSINEVASFIAKSSTLRYYYITVVPVGGVYPTT